MFKIFNTAEKQFLWFLNGINLVQVAPAKTVRQKILQLNLKSHYINEDLFFLKPEAADLKYLTVKQLRLAINFHYNDPSNNLHYTT